MTRVLFNPYTLTLPSTTGPASFHLTHPSAAQTAIIPTREDRDYIYESARLHLL